MRVIFCLLAACYCFLQSGSIDHQASGIMQQLYAGQYTLMSVIYICCAFILFKPKDKRNKGLNNKELIREDEKISRSNFLGKKKKDLDY